MHNEHTMLAYSYFSSDEVIVACDNYIKNRNNRIQREKEKFVSGRMEPGFKPKFLIFGKKTIPGKTREEAESEWQNRYFDYSGKTPKQSAEIYAKEEYEVVYSLLRIAKEAKRKMFVKVSFMGDWL